MEKLWSSVKKIVMNLVLLKTNQKINLRLKKLMTLYKCHISCSFSAHLRMPKEVYIEGTSLKVSIFVIIWFSKDNIWTKDDEGNKFSLNPSEEPNEYIAVSLDIGRKEGERPETPIFDEDEYVKKENLFLP